MNAKKPKLAIVKAAADKTPEGRVLEAQRDEIYLAQSIIVLANHSSKDAPDWATEMALGHAFDILDKVAENLDDLQLSLSKRGAA